MSSTFLPPSSSNASFLPPPHRRLSGVVGGAGKGRGLSVRVPPAGKVSTNGVTAGCSIETALGRWRRFNAGQNFDRGKIQFVFGAKPVAGKGIFGCWRE